jgi:hypothetical protein
MAIRVSIAILQVEESKERSPTLDKFRDDDDDDNGQIGAVALSGFSAPHEPPVGANPDLLYYCRRLSHSSCLQDSRRITRLKPIMLSDNRRCLENLILQEPPFHVVQHRRTVVHYECGGGSFRRAERQPSEKMSYNSWMRDSEDARRE